MIDKPTAPSHPNGWPMFWIAYDPATKNFTWNFEGDLPASGLYMTIDMVKSLMLDKQKMALAQAMQRQAAEQIVLAGGPMVAPRLRT